ncbi:K(+)-transporting ATPase subunit F [Microbulbifer sp. TB1203]
MDWFLLLTVLALAGYLCVAMIWPERF